MKRTAYVRLDADGIIVATGETDEAAFDALAPAGLIKVPAGTPLPLGWRYDAASRTAAPPEEA